MNKQKIETLKSVKKELERCSKRINLAIEEQSTENNYSQRHFAAVKRSALDLKNELTKLTQFKFDYSD